MKYKNESDKNIKIKDGYLTESVKSMKFLNIKATKQSHSFDHIKFKYKFV